MLESPCSLIVGTVGPDGLPDATRGWGVAVDAAGLRLLLAANSAVTIANARSTRRLAPTATDFVTLRSVQIKGVVAAVEEPSADDRARFERFCRGCVDAIHDLDGTSEEIIWRFAPSSIVACTLTVDEIYDQTPGPSAGGRLSPAVSA